MITDWLNSQAYSDATRQQYAYIVSRLTGELDPAHMDAERLRGWLDRQPWGGSMRWMALCAVRSFLRHWYGDEHPALALRIKREQSGPQPMLSAREIKMILAGFPATTKGGRDYSIAALLVDTGLRENEVCRLRIRDVHLSEQWLAARIKGGRTERVIYSDRTAAAIRAWIDLRQQIDHPPTPLLYISIGGKTPGKPLTPRGLQAIVVGWGRALRMERRVTPHMFRRSFAVLATEAGAPTRLVQLAGRWSSVAEVERYTRGLELERFRRYSPMDYIGG